MVKWMLIIIKLPNLLFIHMCMYKHTYTRNLSPIKEERLLNYCFAESYKHQERFEIKAATLQPGFAECPHCAFPCSGTWRKSTKQDRQICNSHRVRVPEPSCRLLFPFPFSFFFFISSDYLSKDLIFFIQ